MGAETKYCVSPTQRLATDDSCFEEDYQTPVAALPKDIRDGKDFRDHKDMPQVPPTVTGPFQGGGRDFDYGAKVDLNILRNSHEHDRFRRYSSEHEVPGWNNILTNRNRSICS